MSRPLGLPRSLDYPAVPVGSILRAAVRRWSDRTAFVQHDLPLSFAELGRRAHAVAGRLHDHGIGRGDVVALHLPNCRQYPSVSPAGKVLERELAAKERASVESG